MGCFFFDDPALGGARGRLIFGQSQQYRILLEGPNASMYRHDAAPEPQSLHPVISLSTAGKGCMKGLVRASPEPGNSEVFLFASFLWYLQVMISMEEHDLRVQGFVDTAVNKQISAC